MLALPGSLERSTLGDLLGVLHRDRVTGTLCLEDESPGVSERYVIHWLDGLIHEVEMPRGSAPGTRDGAASSRARAESDRQRLERLERLEALFDLRRARISFRVMGARSIRTPAPLGPGEFLHGRKRLRDESAGSAQRSAAVESARSLALSTLGLSGEPSAAAINAAFRTLARRWHPDRYPNAGEQTRAALCRRFAQITSAYATLRAEAA